MITISQYVESVENALQYWLDLHTDAETWAEDTSLDSIQDTFKNSPILSNSCYTFNWKNAAIRREAKNTRELFQVCKNCGMINDGFDCCENPRLGKHPSIDELAKWYSEMGIELSDDILMETLVKDGFKVYRNALRDHVQPVINEVKDVLKSIRRSKNNEDRLLAVLWGTRVYHVNGNIMADYGREELSLIDSIRNNGLESVFPKEDINEYINS